MSELIRQITDADFESEVLQSELPVLVDFWATWCGPCKQIAPVLEKMAGDYEGRAKIVKVDVVENTETPGKYGVKAIPALFIFKGGEAVASRMGAAPQSVLAEFLEEHL